jgi:KaiC/GvpD/RAD55 family RecA-like ATPase
MGTPARGSRIFIRQCYRELEQCIKDGIEQRRLQRVVVTGTPGIGKSCFAFYWLWRLRQEGKTVVYQLGSDFYRFTNTTAEYGEDIGVFKRAGYFWDQESWFLCDPEGPPYR